jgi:NADPH2:quinone reductase
MTLPARMTAIAIRAPGGPEMLVPEERPTPAPGPGEILVKVAAAGVNRPDVRQRQGSYPPPKGATDIPGLEIARIEANMATKQASKSAADLFFKK